MADLESIARELAAHLEDEFPPGAKIVTFVAGGEHMFRVTWLAGDDAARPNKRARGVRLHVSEELLDDYFANQHERARGGHSRPVRPRAHAELRREKYDNGTV